MTGSIRRSGVLPPFNRPVVESADEQFEARFLSIYSRCGSVFDARLARSVLDQWLQELDEPARE